VLALLDLRLAMAALMSSAVGIASSMCVQRSESLSGRGLGITYVVAGRSSRN